MNLTPMKAIRLRCLDCAQSSAEVKRCNDHTCPLWPYRLGKKLTVEALKTYTGEGTPSSKSSVRAELMRARMAGEGEE